MTFSGMTKYLYNEYKKGDEKEIKEIVNLYKVQQAFVKSKEDGDEIVNYSEYEETIKNNEEKISEIVKRANLNMARDEDDTPFVKVSFF